METKYSVGDKVKVRADLVSGVMYESETFIGGLSDMGQFKGEEVTIESVTVNSKGEVKYEIVEDEDDYKWNWTESMFE